MKKRIVAIILLISMLTGGCGASSQPSVLRVAIPYSDYVQDPGTNYYIRWLEKKTGLRLEVTLVRKTRTSDYLNTLFASNADIDVILFGGDFTVEKDELEEYVASGDIYSENGRFCYDNYGSSVAERAGQILWINSEWLAKLGLSVPKTTEELYMVLKSFKKNDPNGNGLKDEIPLVGSGSDYSFLPVIFLLNSFVYTDPYHSYFDTNGSNTSPAASEAFRSGLKFIKRLMDEELIDPECFDRSETAFTELINSPEDLIGAFTTDSISDVIYPGNPEIMARYIHVVPMTGPDGSPNALYSRDDPSVGAVILGRSNKKEEARYLLETMMSEEASLIARYGEKDVDWSFSDGKDVSIYGTVSTITTKRYIWNTSQNKNLNGIGPMKVPEQYLTGVTWNGVNSDAEYIDARAQMSYRAYLPKAPVLHEPVEKVTEYIDSAIKEFVTGKRNIEDDSEWERYSEGLQALY